MMVFAKTWLKAFEVDFYVKHRMAVVSFWQSLFWQNLAGATIFWKTKLYTMAYTAVTSEKITEYNHCTCKMS